MENRQENVNEIPVGVKIVSIWYYISSIISLLLGIVGIFAFLRIPTSFLFEIPRFLGISSLFLGPLALIVGLLLIAFAVVSFLIAKNLKKAKKSARIAVIVFSVLGFLESLSPLNIFGLIINGLVGGYIIFSGKVKEFFSEASH